MGVGPEELFDMVQGENISPMIQQIDTLNEKFDLELPESDDYVTIAGFILHFYQKFPKLNETIVIDKYSFKIVKVTATKIELVRMKVVS